MDYKKRVLIKTGFLILIGQLIGAIAFASVLLPNKIVAGGFGGVATIFNELFGWNIQLVLIALCTPVIIWAIFRYDRKQVIYAGVCFALFTFYIGIVQSIIPEFHTDPLVAAVTGGILFGISGGMIISGGSANGPEAIIGMFLKEKTGLTIGNYFVVLNTTIILSSIIYGDLTLIVYSLISNYISSKMTDYIMIGMRRYYVVNVISDNYLDITEFIHKKLERGVTFVQSYGTIDMKKRMMIKTVVSSRELVDLRHYVEDLEDNSFVYASAATSLHGGGFESL